MPDRSSTTTQRKAIEALADALHRRIPREHLGVMTDGPTSRRRGVYVISVAAELAGVHPQTLRIYERKGLVEPGAHRAAAAAATPTRDIELLRRIQELTNEGVNLAGVQAGPRARGRARATPRAEIERLRADAQARRTSPRPRSGHRQYRRDLVPVSKAVVRVRRS